MNSNLPVRSLFVAAFGTLLAANGVRHFLQNDQLSAAFYLIVGLALFGTAVWSASRRKRA